MKRLREGSMIWPEYRLHSIIFALRSLVCMLIVWIEQRFSVGPFSIANVLVVLGTMKLASYSSSICPSGTQLQAGSGTIRELDAPLNMRTFFSILQFHATMGCLYGLRRYSTQFMYVWIIQFTAFLLTLRRKNIAPHNFLTSLYGVMLIAGFFVSSYEISSNDGLQGFLILNSLANGAAFFRLVMKVDKYVLWIGATLLLYAARFATPGLAAFVAAYVLSLGGVVSIFRGAHAKAAKADADKLRAAPVETSVAASAPKAAPRKRSESPGAKAVGAERDENKESSEKKSER